MATDAVGKRVMKQHHPSAIPVVITLILISIVHLLLSNALNITPKQIIIAIFSPLLDFFKRFSNISQSFDVSMFILEQSLIALAILRWKRDHQGWRQTLKFANALITLELFVGVI